MPSAISPVGRWMTSLRWRRPGRRWAWTSGASRWPGRGCRRRGYRSRRKRMGCLAETVGLGDVRDVDAMVAAAVRRLGLILTACEREELESEGLAILCELQGDWDGRGSFAGYASSLLGKRLLTAWHGLAGHSRRRVLDE